MVPGTEKKVSFSALSSVQLPLGVLLRVKLGATKRMKIFLLILLHNTWQQGCNNPVPGLLQPCTMVVTVSIKYKVVTTMFHGCYNLELQPCYNLVAPL